jgi:glycerol-3-phosphate acyltransferase PlsY
MSMILFVLTAVGGYLIGSISSARLVMKLFGGGKVIPDKSEIGLEGSDKKMILGTISASTVSYHIGSKFGFMTYILDVLKIALPTLAAKLIFPEQPYYLIVAAVSMVGHVWPLYHRFKGGRGISAVYGGVLVIDWIGVFTTSIPGMLIGLLVFKDVCMAYMTGVFLVIPWLWFRTHDLFVLSYAIFINIIFLISMIPEIKNWRRIKHEEKWDDPVEVIQLSGMGRGIVKMARKLGVLKKKTTRNADEDKGSKL